MIKHKKLRLLDLLLTISFITMILGVVSNDFRLLFISLYSLLYGLLQPGCQYFLRRL